MKISIVFAITANTYKAYEIPKPDDFEDVVEDFLLWGIRKSFDGSDYLEMAHQLYQLLIAPVLNDFPQFGEMPEDPRRVLSPFGEMSGGQRGSLVIIPDGVFVAATL